MLSRLGPLTPPGEGPPPETTTRLGDWYAGARALRPHGQPQLLGMMNECALDVDDLFRRPLSVVYLDEIDRRLSRTLCRVIGWRTPGEAAIAALEGDA